jgi:hypothetical protein
MPIGKGFFEKEDTHWQGRRACALRRQQNSRVLSLSELS